MTARLRDRHILIVEDHADSRDTLRQLLELEGASVTESASADEALWGLNAAAVDLVVTDVSLRGAAHDGVWLLRELKGSSRFARIPVIAVTGHKEREIELRRLGFGAVLLKPLEPSDLYASIIRCLATT